MKRKTSPGMDFLSQASLDLLLNECNEDGQYNWTYDPNVQSVANADKIRRLLFETKAHVKTLHGKADGGQLMKDLREKLEELTGNVDFAFDEAEAKNLEGKRCILLRALCALYSKTMKDGSATLTGRWIDTWERQMGITVVRTNVARKCWRKGKDGKELKNGQAGCMDPEGETLRVLSDVKELHYLGLVAAGVIVIGIIAASNAAHASFGLAKQTHWVAHAGVGTYEGVSIFLMPHPKYVSPACVNNKGVAITIGASLGDSLSVTSRVVHGWAEIGAELMPDEGEAVRREEVTRELYNKLLSDPQLKADVSNAEMM